MIDEFKVLPNQIDYEDFITDGIKELEDQLLKSPFKERRRNLFWTQVLDENNKILSKPIKHRICEIETNLLRKIINDTDYDNDTNYSLVLRTIWEEYHFRKNDYIKN